MAVTLPPVLLSSTEPVRTPSFPDTYFGPFEYGGALYLAEQSNTITGTPKRIMKSTDNGATWAPQDTGNQPLSVTSRGSVVRSGSILTMFYPENTAALVTVCTFDMATDLFGTPVSSADVTIGSELILRASNGDCFLLFRAVATMSYAIYSSGSISPATVIIASAIDPLNALIDENDLVHFWYNSGGDIFHRTATMAGVISAPDLVYNGPALGRYTIGRPTIWLDPNDGIKKLIVPTNDPPEAYGSMGYLEGTPATSATPAWAFVNVFGSLPASWDSTHPFSFVDSDGVLHVWWINLDFTPPDPADIIDRIYYNSNDGSGWGEPVLFYDEVTNPQLNDPTIDPYDQFIHTLSVSKLLNGLFGVATALEENSLCAGYYLLDGTCDIEIEVGPAPTQSHPSFVPAFTIAMGETGPFPLPPARAGRAYSEQEILPSENGGSGQEFEYTVTSGSMPPGITIGAPSSPRTTTGPIRSTGGFTIQGTPTLTPFTGPTTYQWTGPIRLIQ